MISRYVLLLCSLCVACGLLAQDISFEFLSREGARIGRIYRAAVKVDDINAQNSALAEMDAILSKLKTQDQIDVLTKAFNQSAIEITTPAQDAFAYVLALGAAKEERDDVAVQDALDIITTVKQLYIERSIDQYKQFDNYLKIALQSLDLGILMHSAYADEVVVKSVTSQLNELKEKCSKEIESIKIIDDIYGFFSTRIVNFDYDVLLSAEKLIEAHKSGNKDLIEKTSQEVEYLYKRYYMKKGELESTKFMQKINEIVDASLE